MWQMWVFLSCFLFILFFYMCMIAQTWREVLHLPESKLSYFIPIFTMSESMCVTRFTGNMFWLPYWSLTGSQKQTNTRKHNVNSGVSAAVLKADYSICWNADWAARSGSAWSLATTVRRSHRLLCFSLFFLSLVEAFGTNCARDFLQSFLTGVWLWHSQKTRWYKTKITAQAIM